MFQNNKELRIGIRLLVGAVTMLTIVGFAVSFAAVWLYSHAVGKKRCDIEIIRVLASNDGENVGA